MRGDQLAVNGVGRDVRLVESIQVEQRIAEGVGDKTGYIQRTGFLAGNDLFDQRCFAVVGLRQQLLGLGLLELPGLYKRARQAAKRRILRCCCHRMSLNAV
ncbi:hypothetical protein SDC9_189896 [bioreactor metagenome]|uniref:Uncharacterized protein n=1 Tax=bioreactor metagenome TaxID=1076179 RepID=A0A645HVW8_9ZZZZ